MTAVLISLGFLLLLASAAAELLVVRQQQVATGWLQHAFMVQGDLSQLRVVMTDAETGQRGFLLTGRASYLAPYETARGQAAKAVDKVAADFAGDAKAAGRIAHLRALVAARLEVMARTVALERAGRARAALDLVNSDVGAGLMTDLRRTLGALSVEEFAGLQQRSREYQALSRISQSVLLITPGLIVVLGALLLLQARRQLRALSDANRSLRDEVAHRHAVETQLIQSQKMEAIGQLTGGIAHDFNNMLAVIVGCLDLARRRLGEATDPRAQQYLDQAAAGAERATMLTSRLLAFARRQPLEPEVLECNRLVSGLSQLFRRTIGEDVGIEMVLGAGLWPIRADPAQLENAILNLVVNARDAMPAGGKLTLETANVNLDEGYAVDRPEVAAGDYVMISVTDDGVGMAPEVVRNAFQPFFTTKDVGKGTGLGLSQVFGYVKQSAGHVAIYSELGQGTTVKVYMPRYVGTEAPREAPAKPEHISAGSTEETILVVEDDDAVRRTTVETLRDLGYSVLESNGAAQALTRMEDGAVDLLLTDIVMPGKNGRELALEAQRLYPDLKVLYVTGYTRNAVVHHGVVDPGVALLTKPFSAGQLGRKIREILGPIPRRATAAQDSEAD